MKSLDLDAESWTEDDRSRFYVEGEPVPDLSDPEVDEEQERWNAFAREDKEVCCKGTYHDPELYGMECPCE